MIDWKSFLDSYHIQYVERGSNVAHDHVNISCPFCSDDPSQHLGISLANGAWGCWRNETHRGRSPVRLIQALLRCSRLQAESIANSQIIPSLDSFDDIIQSLSHEVHDTEQKIDKIKFPPNIRLLVDKGMGARFIDYIVDRGYTRDEARHLCEVYNLMYAITGQFAYRIIIPIEMEDGIATWTARDITSTSDLRYKTLKKDESKLSIKECLLGYKSLVEDEESHTLIVCEGPFDALRLDFFGYPFGIRATCLFGLYATDAQLGLLSKITKKFAHKWVCLDSSAKLQALHLRFRLAFLDFGLLYPPDGFKDPAELPKPIIHSWFNEITRLNNLSET